MQDNNSISKNTSNQIGKVLLFLALAFIVYFLYFKYFHKGGSYQ
jgi:hypothetical protein